MHHLTDTLLKPIPIKPSSPTPDPSSSHPSKFHSFALLPPEIRLQIWAETLPKHRILPITFSTLHTTYLPLIRPPITLSINSESRALALAHLPPLALGPPPPAPHLRPPIPFTPLTDTLYLSSLSGPLLTLHLPDLLYNLSTAPARHVIRHVAFDLRIWNQACDAGLCGVLAKMRALETVALVVEFGRGFAGEWGFLETPEWRGDLRWIAATAAEGIREERARRKGVGEREREALGGGRKDVKIGCVLLTRGGEQA